MTSTIVHPLPGGTRTGGTVPPVVVRPATVRVVAAGVTACCVLVCLAALLVVTREGAWSYPNAKDLPADLTVGLAFSLMGGLVLIAGMPGRGSGRIGWLLLGPGAASALTAGATAVALVATEPTAPARAAVQLQSWLWVPGFFSLLTVLPLLYPDGGLPSRWRPAWRVALVSSVLGMGLFALAVAAHPEPFHGRVTLTKPWTSETLAQLLMPVAAPLLVASVLAATVSLVVRIRESSGLARRQVVVLLAAAGVVVVDILVMNAVPQPWRGVSQAAAVALVPVAIGVAVTRHRLYDLDLAICRVLAGVSLAVCLAGIYLSIFAVLAGVFPGQDVLSGALAAGVTGLLLQPLGARLTRGVDRLYYGDRADPYAVTSGMIRRLRDSLDVAEVPRALCDTVVDSLRLGSATLLTDVEGHDHVLARRSAEHDGSRDGAGDEENDDAGRDDGGRDDDGDPGRDEDGDRTMSFALRHGGEVVGRLLVTPRPQERSIGARDAELLATLADQAAAGVAALRLHQSLLRSREALVAAREEERRRLRRDLHDGLGAALAGLRLQLESARELVTEPVAQKLIDSASAGAAEAVRDVRHITDDLRPPALDQLGLPGALAALTDRLGSAVTDVRLEVAGEVTDLPAAVEVACYRIAAEALGNAVRHSGARHVVLDVTLRARALTLEVRDDGHGLPEVPRPGGFGLTSMRQRTEEIGGSFHLTSSTSGTLVRAELPVEAS